MVGKSPYMRTRDSIHRKNSPFYGPERFTCQPDSNRYICAAGQPLNPRAWGLAHGIYTRIKNETNFEGVGISIKIHGLA
jgi:hypothetical protein